MRTQHSPVGDLTEGAVGGQRTDVLGVLRMETCTETQCAWQDGDDLLTEISKL